MSQREEDAPVARREDRTRRQVTGTCSQDEGRKIKLAIERNLTGQHFCVGPAHLWQNESRCSVWR